MLVHFVYYLFMIPASLGLVLYLTSFWQHAKEVQKDYEYVQQARALSAQDIVEYKSVEPDSDSYKVWEQVSYVTTRRVKPIIKDFPSKLEFEDTFFCDVFSEHRWVRRYSQIITSNNNPEITTWYAVLWAWNVDMTKLPNEPAECYWRHTINVCPYIDWVECKPQTVISWPFIITE